MYENANELKKIVKESKQQDKITQSELNNQIPNNISEMRVYKLKNLDIWNKHIYPCKSWVVLIINHHNDMFMGTSLSICTRNQFSHISHLVNIYHEAQYMFLLNRHNIGHPLEYHKYRDKRSLDSSGWSKLECNCSATSVSQ